MTRPLLLLALLAAAATAQNFNQQYQNADFRVAPGFRDNSFSTQTQESSQQVTNFFRPSEQLLSSFQPSNPPNHSPARNVQQQPPPQFQRQQSQQQNSFLPPPPQQQQQPSFQPPQQTFQPPTQDFSNFNQQNNFRQPQSSFQQPTFQQPNFQQQQQFNNPPQQQQNNFVQQSPPQQRQAPQQQQQHHQQQHQRQQQQQFFNPPATQPPQPPTTAAPVTPTQEELEKQFSLQLGQRDSLLQQLDQSTLLAAANSGSPNQITLPNGQKVQVLTVPPKSGAVTTTPAPRPKIKTIETNGGLLDAVTQGVVPDGIKYEVIRQKQDGDLETVKGLPSDLPKKVTFVLLEEQDDGSFKVQGVRKGAGIPEGSDIAAEAAKAAKSGEDDNQEVQNIIKKLQDGKLKLPSGVVSATTPRPVFTTPRAVATSPRARARPSTTPAPVTFAPPTTTTHAPVEHRGHLASQSSPVVHTVPSPNALKKSQPSTLGDALRAQGLRSMAQFLEQVGLDKALNDSTPFTMFAPTDLAFRALLLELGGAERAQAKFKASPRLLSGLLLHHVIPGYFKVNDLQDEMTGVSLAGTQLRVNVYSNTDQSFNPKKVVTVNGGAVFDRTSDIPLPGGSVAHAVNKVLFPLPVGDIMTSLEADPGRRFIRLVGILKDSALDQLLVAPAPDSPDDGRTFSFFAPTDEALSGASPEIIQLLEASNTPERKAALKVLLERHIAPGTLFSEGVTYYQAASTLAADQPLRLFNDHGVFKVNSARVVTPDIPATNGVIHALDRLL